MNALFDLEKQYAFYGAYHSNPVNVFLHMLFVWPNFFTILMLFYFTPVICKSASIELWDHSLLVFNFGFFFSLMYALFYVFLEKKAGCLAALLCFVCWVFSSQLAFHMGFSLTWKVVWAAQSFCWIAQVIGHRVFEKRSASGLLDNLVQGLLMVPFLVLLEALYSFGYEPYPGFHARLRARIDAEMNKWQQEKQKKVT